MDKKPSDNHAIKSFRLFFFFFSQLWRVNLKLITITNNTFKYLLVLIDKLRKLWSKLIFPLVFSAGPHNVTATPTDPPTLPSLSLTGAPAVAPPDPSITTIPPTTTTTTAAAMTITIAAETTTTTTESTVVEEDAEPSGPNGTGRLLPRPQTPTDAPEEPPDTDPLLPPPEEEEDVDNGTTFVPDTPTTDLYGEEVTMETEATTEPDMEFPSDLTPHGECVSVLIYWADTTPPSTLRLSHRSSSPIMSNSIQAMLRCVLSCWHESQ